MVTMPKEPRKVQEPRSHIAIANVLAMNICKWNEALLKFVYYANKPVLVILILFMIEIGKETRKAQSNVRVTDIFAMKHRKSKYSLNEICLPCKQSLACLLDSINGRSGQGPKESNKNLASVTIGLATKQCNCKYCLNEICLPWKTQLCLPPSSYIWSHRVRRQGEHRAMLQPCFCNETSQMYILLKWNLFTMQTKLSLPSWFYLWLQWPRSQGKYTSLASVTIGLATKLCKCKYSF